MKSRILLIEDEASIAEVQKAYFQSAGFLVEHKDNGEDGLSYLKDNPVSLVVLDLMLPGMDGNAVCTRIRQFSDVPIIMVTAKVEELDRLIGLEIGADDYVCKPFSPRELVARAKVILRRMPQPESGIRIGELSLNPEHFEACLKGKKLELTRREFELLVLFAEKQGRTLSREFILDSLYREADITDRSIDSHIKNLRKKLKQADPENDWVRTVYGQGYKLEAD